MFFWFYLEKIFKNVLRNYWIFFSYINKLFDFDILLKIYFYYLFIIKYEKKMVCIMFLLFFFKKVYF